MHRFIQTRGFTTTGTLAIRRTRARAAAGKTPFTPREGDAEVTSSPSSKADSTEDTTTPSKAQEEEGALTFDDLLALRPSGKSTDATTKTSASNPDHSTTSTTLGMKAASVTLDKSLETTPAPSEVKEVRVEKGMNQLESFLRDAMKEEPTIDIQRLWIEGLGVRHSQNPNDYEEVKTALESAPHIIAESRFFRTTPVPGRSFKQIEGAAFEYIRDPRTPKDAWILSPGYQPRKTVPWNAWDKDQVRSWESRAAHGLSDQATTTILANGSLSRKHRRDLSRAIRTIMAKAKVPTRPSTSKKA
ncbi:MAG: hypothetical protein DHS80DRAFT_33223 [Piptocephalis tieghemiana]|nr:MAG: hypothetical protein DHS80DRAFT_33223 [Piptocephalis tieghemiana]